MTATTNTPEGVNTPALSAAPILAGSTRLPSIENMTFAAADAEVVALLAAANCKRRRGENAEREAEFNIVVVCELRDAILTTPPRTLPDALAMLNRLACKESGIPAGTIPGQEIAVALLRDFMATLVDKGRDTTRVAKSTTLEMVHLHRFSLNGTLDPFYERGHPMRENFTASEAQTLTGINVETQRVWRRRHLKIGTGEGWTRYRYSDVVVLACLAELTKAGVAIGHAIDIVSRDEVWRSIMIERDYDRIGEPLEDRMIVTYPVTTDGMDPTYGVVLCVLSDLQKIFFNPNGGYFPDVACLTVLNTSYVRRQVDERMKKLT